MTQHPDIGPSNSIFSENPKLGNRSKKPKVYEYSLLSVIEDVVHEEYGEIDHFELWGEDGEEIIRTIRRSLHGMMVATPYYPGAGTLFGIQYFMHKEDDMPGGLWVFKKNGDAILVCHDFEILH